MTTIRGTEEQRATFVELFDLVFGFAVTQVSASLAHDLTASGLLRAFDRLLARVVGVDAIHLVAQ